MKPPMAPDQSVVRSLRESVSVKQAVLENPELIDSIGKVGMELTRALQNGRKAFFLSNDGGQRTGNTWLADLGGSLKGNGMLHRLLLSDVECFQINR